MFIFDYIYAQDHSILENSSPYNGESTNIQVELPKLSLRDAAQDNSLSTLSSPAAPSGPLSPPLDPMGSDIGDLHDVPINDDRDSRTANLTKSQSMEEVQYSFFFIQSFKSIYFFTHYFFFSLRTYM